MKCRGPLFSFGASKSVGKTVTYRKGSPATVATGYATPTDPRSPAQIGQRARVGVAVAAWGFPVYVSDTLEAWNRVPGYLRKPMAGYHAAISAMTRAQAFDADPSFVIDAAPWGNLQVRFRLANIDSANFADEPGSFTILYGTSATRLNPVDSKTLSNGMLITSALTAQAETGYVAVIKDGCFRSGIHRLSMISDGYEPPNYLAMTAWWLHKISEADALAGVYPDESPFALWPGSQPTAANRPTWNDDDAHSLTYDAVDDIFDCGDITPLQGINAFTISAWMDPPTGVEPNRCPWSVGQVHAVNMLSWQVTKDGVNPTRRTMVWVAGPAGGYYQTAYVTWNRPGWNHIVVRVCLDEAAHLDMIRLWLNGNEQVMDRRQLLPALTPVTSPDPFLLGYRPETADLWKGGLAEIQLWDQALTSVQCAAMFDNQKYMFGL